MAGSEWDDKVVHSISTAPISAAEDQRHRVRVYLISMSIRTGSFILAGLFGFVLNVPWAAWAFMIAAVVLPYPAVVLANNRDRHQTAPTIVSPLRAIGDRPHAASDSDEYDGYTFGGVAETLDRPELEAPQADAAQRSPGHEVQRPVRRTWMSG